MPQWHHWTMEENKEVLHCYFAANPSSSGYRMRMYELWSGRNPGWDITEQRVADQALSLLRQNVFTSVELQYLQQQASNQSDLSTNSTLSSAESLSGVLSTSSVGAQTQDDASHPDCVAATCLTKDQMDLKETLLNYMKKTRTATG